MKALSPAYKTTFILFPTNAELSSGESAIRPLRCVSHSSAQDISLIENWWFQMLTSWIRRASRTMRLICFILWVSSLLSPWQSIGKKLPSTMTKKTLKWSTFLPFSTKQCAVLHNLVPIWMRIGFIIGFKSPFQKEIFSYCLTNWFGEQISVSRKLLLQKFCSKTIKQAAPLCLNILCLSRDRSKGLLSFCSGYSSAVLNKEHMEIQCLCWSFGFLASVHHQGTKLIMIHKWRS